MRNGFLSFAVPWLLEANRDQKNEFVPHASVVNVVHGSDCCGA